VLHDFLKRLVKSEIFARIAPHINKGTNIVEDPPQLQFYHFDQDPFIPIEFSVAAYRLGHSMVGIFAQTAVWVYSRGYPVKSCWTGTWANS
jgi:hypothetical protein